MNDLLLRKFTDAALPALRESREPVEPSDWESTEVETGRSPDEVVSRERRPVERFDEETTIPASPRKPQTQPRQTYAEPVQHQEAPPQAAPAEVPQVRNLDSRPRTRTRRSEAYSR
jgi:hypothetical protein